MIAADAAVTVSRCPACHGDCSSQVGERASGFDTVIDGRHYRQPDYVVRLCDTCGLYFKSETMAPPLLEAYYDALDSHAFEVDADFPTDRVLHERLDSLAAGSRVLDFGCSTGRILKSLTGRLKCVGVEPNKAAAATARGRGIEIVETSELLHGDRRFDAILLTDVFEHLAEPLPLLQMLAGLLTPGGWLAIVTGNADAIRSRRHFAEFWYFRLPGHLIMLGERHLPWMAEQMGLRLADVRRCSHYSVAAKERLRQRVQAFAYETFRSSPNGAAARVMRMLPGLSNAARWTTAPALNYRPDHVVAFFARPNR